MSDAYAEGRESEPRHSKRHRDGRRSSLLWRSHLAVRAFLSIALLAVAGILAFENVDLSQALESLAVLPINSVLLALLALGGGAVLAVVRLKLVSQDFGYRLAWRDAFAALGLGQLGAALFFQIVGQLVARGTYLSRRGIPMAATVLVVGYERILALIVSLTLAASGAWYIFGHIALDLRSGGDELLKLTGGIGLAILAGAWLAWGRIAAQHGASVLGNNPIRRALRATALSLGIQLATAFAYVSLAHALSPSVSYFALAAASFVIMFAASLPISLSGWGVRELSAVAVLGVVGVPLADALIAAALVGLGSLVVICPFGALALIGNGQTPQPPAVVTTRIDYSRLASFLVPLAAATAVFFNLHLPTEGGGINVNLADPLAILGGALFLFHAVVQRQTPPKWRLPGTNLHVLLATSVMTVALLIGASRIGWSEWALANKYIGWFVLLAYGATGAMVATGATRGSSRPLVATLMAAGLAVACLELFLEAVRSAGFDVPINILYVDATGFAQNRNAFAFQMLMVVAAVVALAPRQRITTVALGIALAALWFAGSRAGWIVVALMLFMAHMLGALTWRQIALALLCAIGIAGFINVLWIIDSIALGGDHLIRELSARSSVFSLDDSTTAERVKSLLGGLALFLEYPLFGAGLGSFLESELETTGIALVIHSTPLWIAAEMGLLGLIVFTLPVIRIVARELPHNPGDGGALLLVMIIAGLSIMSLFHEILYQRTFWLLLGAGLAWTADTRNSTGDRKAARSSVVRHGEAGHDRIAASSHDGKEPTEYVSLRSKE